MKKIINLAILLFVMMSLVIGCGSNNNSAANSANSLDVNFSELEDGTFTGTGQGFKGEVTVEVVVENEEITRVEVIEHSETDGIADPAIEGIPQQIIEKQSLDVDAVAGATRASDAVVQAVADALSK